MFLATTAEEQGLLGSEYYATTPILPLVDAVADINIDTLNVHGRTTDVTNVGEGTDGASDLDGYLRAAAAEQHREVRADPEPEKGHYYRSDHFSFAKRGVPALDAEGGVLFAGKGPEYGRDVRTMYLEHAYHKPADEVGDDWDLSGAIEDLELLTAVGYRVAQAEAPPEIGRAHV